MSKAAYVLRRFTDAGAGTRHPKGAVLKNLTAGEFANFAKAGLVREATDAERGAESPKSEVAPPPSERSLSAPKAPPKRKSSRKAAS